MASRAIWLLLGLAAAKPHGVRLRARVSEIHVAGKLALGAEVGGNQEFRTPEKDYSIPRRPRNACFAFNS